MGFYPQWQRWHKCKEIPRETGPQDWCFELPSALSPGIVSIPGAISWAYGRAKFVEPFVCRQETSNAQQVGKTKVILPKIPNGPSSILWRGEARLLRKKSWSPRKSIFLDFVILVAPAKGCYARSAFARWCSILQVLHTWRWLFTILPSSAPVYSSAWQIVWKLAIVPCLPDRGTRGPGVYARREYMLNFSSLCVMLLKKAS